MARLEDRAYLALKAGFRRLVERCGGQQAILAHALTRGGQTDLSRWASPNDEHGRRMPPVDVVADLEDAAGAPIVTRILAERANCLLVPMPQLARADDAIDEHTIRSGRDYAAMVAAIIDAKRDGRITRRTAPGLLRDIRDTMIELAALAEAVTEVAAEGRP